MAAHHEIHLETYVVKKLVENGWVEGDAHDYDKERALYPADVVQWVKTAQAEAWDKLNRLNGASTQNVLLDRLEKALAAKAGGTMKVLRQGFDVAGAGPISMSQPAPEDDRNTKEVAKYEKNILRVVRQLKYCPTREWSIDLGFFINGIPVATVELKTDFTQAIEDAISQYKTDRLPIDPNTRRKEPLLTFKRGAVVHFAISDSEIAMTTKLDGDNTFFLPFNKGNNGHAGNAARDDEYPVAYFWEEICTRDAWLRIFQSFVYVETKDKVDKSGMPYKSETMIFPRYHQFEAVNTMIADAKDKGAGQQYLCEHSAGSGKTSTIAWVAHDLIKLRYPDGKAYFNSVIIVTDRNVLDAQLQDAVKQLDHQFGLIETIEANQRGGESKSKRLATALKNNVPIIVVTIQTFPFAMEAILTEQSLKDRHFAVIIDEAHTSQTGSTAQGLRAALSLDAKVKLEEMTLEEVLLEIQKSRVRPTNVSHFAFTATPKHSTMTLFGRPEDPAQPPSDENKPKSFHRYTQRQAIEEGFILDVLKNYMPYETAYKLGEQGVKDKRVDKKFARRALARWKSLHPTVVAQKVEFIIDHFMQNIAGLLNGEAKAMVVTSGRPQAVKYKLAFDLYIEKHKLQGIKALVAFSGKVPGSLLGEDDEREPLGIDIEKEYTEYNLNPDAGSNDLRNEFEQSEFRVMIVANKFQTGFNQPKLVAMYLDKKLSGVEAVQTLSRLNRTYPGKDETYVIDFVNEPKTILDAFKLYDEGAEIESVQDINVIYDMKGLLDDAGIYIHDDLEAFKKVRGKVIQSPKKTENLHKKLYSATQRPTDVFNSKLKMLTDAIEKWDLAIDKAHKEGDKKGKNYAEAQRSEFAIEREALMRFKTDLARFVRTYNYVAQLMELGDADLENFASFARLFSKRLKGISPEQIDLTGLVLAGFNIRDKNNDEEGESDTLKPITVNEANASDREKEFISEIILRMNNLFGDISDDIGQRHFTSQIVDIAMANEQVNEQVAKNTKDQALQGDLPNVVKKATVDAMQSHSELARVLLKDSQNMNEFFSLVYDIMKKGDAIDLIK